MAPVRRPAARQAAPSRHAAAPTQARRNAAAQPAPRGRAATPAAEPEESTAFDAADSDEEEEQLFEGDLPEVIDLSEVQAATYEVVPRGIYEGYVESVEYGLSQSKNLPMLTWVLKFDYNDKERTLRYYTTLSGDGAGRTKATLARLAPDLDLSQLVPADLDEYFAEMEVKIRVTIRPDRDDRTIKRNNVSDIMPLEEGFADDE